MAVVRNGKILAFKFPLVLQGNRPWAPRYKAKDAG